LGPFDSEIILYGFIKPGFQGFNKMSLMNILGFAMSFVYLGIGIFLLISTELFNFSNLQQKGLGAVILLYGSARFYLALKKKRESEIDENDEFE
jgi:hypothetical protein